MATPMDIEYEATFTNIDKTNIRQRLSAAGATLQKPEFLQRRVVFSLPAGHEIAGGWARVRDEGDKITLSVKAVQGTHITDQKESCITIHSFSEGAKLLTLLGCQEKAYQETKRELWTLDNVEITIDEWPFLEPFVEVEGKSEGAVHAAAEKIGFNWHDARFCVVGTLYSEKYGLAEDTINNHTPKIVFEMENPFNHHENN